MLDPPAGRDALPAGDDTPPAVDDHALLDGLTGEQAQAARHDRGPLLIYAGPGAGKTRTLIYRIARLLATGAARPWEILAVTFSVRAASELQLRLADLLSEQVAGQVTAATFHSVCARMLREHAHVFGRTGDYTIYDQTDMRRVIEWLLSDHQRTDIQRALADHGLPAAAEVATEISLAKNRLLTADSYQQTADHTAADVVAATWRQLDIELQRCNAFDFDSLLVYAVRLLSEHPHRLAFYRQRWRHLLVDEYQDTNEAQGTLLALLGGPDGNVVCVGDDDQCVLEGTAITMPDGSTRPVERIRAGEKVLSSYGRGVMRPARVTRARKREEQSGIRVDLENGETLTTTADHTHFAGFVTSHCQGRFFVYLMWRKDKGFRVGLAAGVYSIGQSDVRFGPAHRGLVERADAVWVLAVRDSEVEARYEEARTAATYGLPTTPFVSVGHDRLDRSLVSSQTHIDRLFRECDTTPRGQCLLEDSGLAADLPHYQPGTRTMLARYGEARYVINVTLCSDRRYPTPLHRISIQGSDPEGRRALEELDIPVRDVPSAGQAWAFVTQRRNYGEVVALADMIASRLGAVVRQTAALGDPRSDGRHAICLPMVPARHVRPGMVMITGAAELVRVTDVRCVALGHPVYDLDVEGTHNFVANGIVTHNCLYSFRAAEPRNLLAFGERYPGHATIVLGRNFRSKAEILNAAVACVSHNTDRQPKALIAMRGPGGHVQVHSFSDDLEEARWVARQVAGLVAEGVAGEEVLVLARTGYGTGPVQRALAQAGVAHRVLGSLGLYERSEIKDALAYLTLVANPVDAQAFRRAVSSPRRGVGDHTADQVLAAARDQHAGDLIAAAAHAQNIAGIRSQATREQVTRFGQGLRHVRGELTAGRSIGHVAIATVTIAGGPVVHQQQRRDNSEDPEQRRDAERVLEDLRSLCRAAQTYADRTPHGTLSGFLEQAVGLHAHTIAPGEPDRRITVSTIHRAKGTEASVVVLVACEERLLPSWRSVTDQQLAEERRLFYVAATRAKDQLLITHAARRNRRETAGPSRFLTEAGLIEHNPQALAA